MHTSRSIPTRSGRRLAALAVTAALAAGCRNPLDLDDDLARRVATEHLQGIETISLPDRSASAPVTVDEAAAARETIAPDAPESPTIELSLAETRAAALENNLDLRVQLVAPAIAEQSVSEEEAKFEALFFGSIGRFRQDAPSPVVDAGNKVSFDQTNLGVQVPLRTGGTVTVELPFSRTDTDNPFATLNPAYDTNVRFSISQPLLRNAGVRANTHSIRVARLEQYISGAQTKLETIRVLTEAERSYWQVYAARQDLEVRQQQYELALEQLGRARRRVNAGEAAEIEIFRAESGVATRLEDIIVADNALRRRQRELKRVINRPDLPLGSRTAILPTTEPAPIGLDLDAAELVAFAIDNRMELLEQELRLAIDASSIRFERNAALPLFTLDYAYTINGLDTTLGSSLDQVGERSFEDWSLALNVEVPLGNEAAEARVNRALLTRLQRLATREQRELAIRQEVLDALDSLNDDWQRILAARQEVILAGRTLAGEESQFENGLRTSTDVLDAATSLADAQLREIQALVDYQISQVDLAFATGTLLGHGRVRWEPATVEQAEAAAPAP